MATPALVQDMRMEPVKTVDTETRMIELASSPNFNPETFKLLVDMMNQNRDRFAVEQFNAAMSLAQAEMRPIAADANNPQTRSKYASYGAIDKALRTALGAAFPSLDKVHLTDYKVRILDGATATGAVTRVLIDFTNGKRSWTTIGVSGNIIEASWHALEEGLVYGLLHAPT